MLACRTVDHGIVSDIALCIIAAWLAGVLCQMVRQPLLIAYLVAGFAIGPHGLRFVTDPESIRTISEIGLALLLFMIGLEMDLKKMLGAGRVITVTALAQIAGCVAIGWLFFGLLGPAAGWLEALYLAVALAMSSTVIIIKLLHDKRELETLAGRVTLGILVLQDVFVILFLAIQPNLKDPAAGPLALAFGKVLLLVGAAYGASRFVLPPVFRKIARQPELVLVGALSWCFAMSGFAAHLGLSREMGALVAGVMLSTFPYTLDVVAKVTNIRDFFVTLFFVALGMIIPLPTADYLLWMLVFGLVLVASRLLTVFPALFAMRQGHRMSLLPAIHLSQLSELSLVLLAIGKASGDVSERSVGIAAFAFAFLAVTSTYGILKSDPLVRRVSPVLAKLGLPDLPGGHADAGHDGNPRQIFLLGFFETASSLVEEIARDRPDLLPRLKVIDFNPETIAKLRARGIEAIYGDISQRDVLEHAGIGHAEAILCTLPDSVLRGTSNRKLLKQLRELNPAARVIVHAGRIADVAGFYEEGASHVLTPRLLEARELLGVLEDEAGVSRPLPAERNEVVP